MFTTWDKVFLVARKKLGIASYTPASVRKGKEKTPAIITKFCIAFKKRYLAYKGEEGGWGGKRQQGRPSNMFFDHHYKIIADSSF